MAAAIDNKGGTNPDVKINKTYEKLPDADLVIVTVQYDYIRIKENIGLKVRPDCKVISLEEVLRSALERNKNES